MTNPYKVQLLLNSSGISADRSKSSELLTSVLYASIKLVNLGVEVIRVLDLVRKSFFLCLELLLQLLELLRDVGNFAGDNCMVW